MSGMLNLSETFFIFANIKSDQHDRKCRCEIKATLVTGILAILWRYMGFR